MELKVKHRIITAVLCLFSLSSNSQDLTQHPPEPRMDHEDGHGPEPCGQNDGGGTTPPVGLCLPIDDYLYPFLIIAIFYGAYKVRKIEIARN